MIDNSEPLNQDQSAGANDFVHEESQKSKELKSVGKVYELFIRPSTVITIRRTFASREDARDYLYQNHPELREFNPTPSVMEDFTNGIFPEAPGNSLYFLRERDVLSYFPHEGQSLEGFIEIEPANGKPDFGRDIGDVYSFYLGEGDGQEIKTRYLATLASPSDIPIFIETHPDIVPENFEKITSRPPAKGKYTIVESPVLTLKPKL